MEKLNQEVSPTKSTPNICQTSVDPDFIQQSSNTENNSEMTALNISDVPSTCNKSICKPTQLIEDENVSLRDVIKLNKTENVWKPTHLVEDDKVSIEDRDTLDLFKRVRGILNKLTPEKFVSLVGELKTLTIDTPKKLDGVIQLIYEKAVDEPNFPVAYAQMCKALAFVPEQKPTEPRTAAKVPTFRSKLINLCQFEFTKLEEDVKAKSRLKLIKKCKDKSAELEEEEHKYRCRSTGTVRFIGELFKLELITSKIMYSCVRNLLDYDSEIKSEESLECVCKLLTTVGSKLEKSIDLTSDLKYMQDIVNSKTHKISSRVRFMLQDVIDLGKKKWASKDENSKTMGQIQKEAELEQKNIQLMNYFMPSKDDRRCGGRGSGNSMDNKSGGGNNNNNNNNNRGRGGNNMDRDQRGRQQTTDFDCWSTQGPKNKHPTYSNINKNNLKAKAMSIEIDGNTQLGQAIMFKNPSKSSSSSTSSNNNIWRKNNSFRSTQQQHNDYPNRTIMLPSSSTVTGSRNNAYRSSIENQQQHSSQQHLQKTQQQKQIETFNEFKNENLITKTFNLIEKYVNGSLNIDYCIYILIHKIFNTNVQHNNSKNYRIAASEILSKCVKINIINIDNLLSGIKQYLVVADDKINVWEIESIGEILALLLKEKIITLNVLVNSLNELIEKKLFGCLLRHMFTIFINENGIEFVRDLWNNSNNIKWIDVLSKEENDEFINKYS